MRSIERFDEELRWYAHEAAGDLGARASGMEPTTKSQGLAPQGLSKRQEWAASRYREIRAAMRAIDETHDGVVRAAFGPAPTIRLTAHGYDEDRRRFEDERRRFDARLQRGARLVHRDGACVADCGPACAGPIPRPPPPPTFAVAHAPLVRSLDELGGILAASLGVEAAESLVRRATTGKGSERSAALEELTTLKAQARELLDDARRAYARARAAQRRAA